MLCRKNPFDTLFLKYNEGLVIDYSMVGSVCKLKYIIDTELLKYFYLLNTYCINSIRKKLLYFYHRMDATHGNSPSQ